MKYIKKYKIITERYSNTIEDELIDYIDDNTIEEWYDKNYTMDADEIATSLAPNYVWDNFDKERFKEDFMYDMKTDHNYDDYDDYEFKEFIKKELTYAKEDKIIELYNENNYDENDEDDEPVTEFDIDYLEDLDKDQLIEVIEVDSDQDDFIEFITHYIYDGYDVEDIFSEFYGVSEKSFQNQNRYSYSSYNTPNYYSFGEYLWKNYRQYIDEDGIVDDWKNNEDFEYKKEVVKDNIYSSPELQEKILKKKTVLLLAELFEQNPKSENISGTYKFQQTYINKKLKDDLVWDKNDKEYNEEKFNIISDALEYLDDNFELNDTIKKRYPDEMFKVDAKKYGM